MSRSLQIKNNFSTFSSSIQNATLLFIQNYHGQPVSETMIDEMSAFAIEKRAYMAQTITVLSLCYLTSEPWKTRQKAMLALEKIARADKEAAIPVSYTAERALKDSDIDVKQAAVLAITALGSHCPRRAVELLTLAKQDPDSRVQTKATDGLVQLAALHTKDRQESPRPNVTAPM